jgi:hypothetical protein
MQVKMSMEFWWNGTDRRDRSARTPWIRVLPEKLIGPQLVKKFPAFYGTRRFIIAFTSAFTCPYPEPDPPSPCLPIPLLEDLEVRLHEI